MNKQLKQGFTLVEIMIVVAIIGIHASIAVPNFIKSRKTSQMNACISNLKQLQAAKEQCLINGESLSNINDYLKNSVDQMKCPADKSKGYTLGDADVDPVCNAMHNDRDYPHKLPNSTGTVTPPSNP